MTYDDRILLIAPYADPDDVGEAWSTFRWVEGLLNSYQHTTLLTLHKKNRSIAERFRGHEVISWEEIQFFAKYERFNAGLKPSYFSFYLKAKSWLKKEISRGRQWDLAHQISPLALRYPSPLSELHIPYIIGPLAGSIPTPRSFAGEYQKTHWFTKLRLLDSLRFRYDPSLRKTYRKASLVLGVAPYVREILKDIPLQRFEIMNETGIDSLHKVSRSKLGKLDTLSLIYVGRIVRTKGLLYLIRALGLLKNRVPKKICLHVFGDGEDLDQCEQTAKQLGLDQSIYFHGWLPKQTVFDFYGKSDVFISPSWKEPSGNVILEAMSFGLPIIVCESGGPGYTVKKTFGIKVKSDSPAALVHNLAEAIQLICEDSEELECMSEAALAEAQLNHLWTRKIDLLISMYDNILRKPKYLNNF